MTTLIKTDTKLGEGAEAQAGQTVIVHYTGWLFDESAPENKGTKFDSSLDRNEPAGVMHNDGLSGLQIGGAHV